MLKRNSLEKPEKPILLVFAIVASASFTQCGDEGKSNGDEPVFATLTGTVTFTGNPPTAGEVLVAIWESYHVTGPPAGVSDMFENGGDATVHDFRIENIPFDSYAYIAVFWSDPEETDYSKKFHDISTESPDALPTLTFSVDAHEQTLDFTADWSKL